MAAVEGSRARGAGAEASGVAVRSAPGLGGHRKDVSFHSQCGGEVPAGPARCPRPSLAAEPRLRRKVPGCSCGR